jgi:hypothetical protein
VCGDIKAVVMVLSLARWAQGTPLGSHGSVSKAPFRKAGAKSGPISLARAVYKEVKSTAAPVAPSGSRCQEDGFMTT